MAKESEKTFHRIAQRVNSWKRLKSFFRFAANARTRADERVLRHLRPNPPPQPELFDHTSVLRRGGSTYAIDFTGHMATTMRLPSMADLYNMGGA